MVIQNIVKTIALATLVDIVIPTVNNKKYIESSSGLFTGWLNLIIDNAPTIPKDKAILPEMTVVITSQIIGKIQNVVTLEKLFAQFCPDNTRDKLINPPIKIDIKHLKRNSNECKKKLW